jgi:hypothetical protein
LARKVFVEVTLRQDVEGNTRPLSFVWEDGTEYEVDRLLHVCRAAATKVGGSGIRYTVTVCGRETYLFEDEDRWFVEAKE